MLCLIRVADHPFECNLGGAINRMHEALSQLVVVFCRDVGQDAKLEVVAPEFVRPKPPEHFSFAERKQWLKDRAPPKSLAVHERRQWEHAIMDVMATHPFLAQELLIDVTVRHPMAVNRANVATEPGVAASVGEADKFRQYPPCSGKSVLPAAMAGLGRIACPCCSPCMLMGDAGMKHMASPRAAAVGYAQCHHQPHSRESCL